MNHVFFLNSVHGQVRECHLPGERVEPGCTMGEGKSAEAV